MPFGKTSGFRIGGPLTPAVKFLLICNFAIFIIQQIVALFSPELIDSLFGLSYYGIAQHHFFWQIFTYMFLHGGWIHIFFNLFSLWVFGGDLEQLWGSRRFISYYLFAGVGAGIFITLMNVFMTTRNPALGFVPTVGASGAIYALLLAYGMIWPNREVLVYFLFPVKIKYLLIFFGLIEFFGTLNSIRGVEGNISHIGHIGGLFTGFIILMAYRRKHPAYRSSSSLFSFVARKIRNRRKQKLITTRIQAKETIDRLLDKIAKQGMSSLSHAEKKELEWARKYYYPSEDEIIH
ncbi:MAG TPA: rhomboid family intramembrane serine protease [Spirochaetota bacterium]